MDPYTILNLNRNCSKDEIKKTFYKLAHIHHPDKGGDEKKFKEINAAYQWLQKNHGQHIYQPQDVWRQGAAQTTVVRNENGWTIYQTTYTNF